MNCVIPIAALAYVTHVEEQLISRDNERPFLLKELIDAVSTMIQDSFQSKRESNGSPSQFQITPRRILLSTAIYWCLSLIIVSSITDKDDSIHMSTIKQLLEALDVLLSTPEMVDAFATLQAITRPLTFSTMFPNPLYYGLSIIKSLVQSYLPVSSPIQSLARLVVIHAISRVSIAVPSMLFEKNNSTTMTIDICRINSVNTQATLMERIVSLMIIFRGFADSNQSEIVDNVRHYLQECISNYKSVVQVKESVKRIQLRLPGAPRTVEAQRSPIVRQITKANIDSMALPLKKRSYNDMSLSSNKKQRASYGYSVGLKSSSSDTTECSSIISMESMASIPSSSSSVTSMIEDDVSVSEMDMHGNTEFQSSLDLLSFVANAMARMT